MTKALKSQNGTTNNNNNSSSNSIDNADNNIGGGTTNSTNSGGGGGGKSKTSKKNKRKGGQRRGSGRDKEVQDDDQDDEDEDEVILHQNPIYDSVAFFTNQSEANTTMPGEKKKKNGSKDDVSRSRDREEWNEMETLDHNGGGGYNTTGKWKEKPNGNHSHTNTPVIQDYMTSNNSAERSTTSDVDATTDKNNRYSSYSNGQASIGSGNSSSYHPHHHPHPPQYETAYNNYDYDYDIEDQGPHREMAIDVPENFVASVKSPPRFPPHLSSSSSSNKQNNRNSNTNNNNNSSGQYSPNKSNHRDSRGDMSESDHNNKSSSTQSHQYQPTQEELNRLHKHQEELKKRREDESRIQAEEQFLRESLRGSKKMQALEKRRRQQQQPAVISPQAGFVNTAFDNHGDVVGNEQDYDVDDDDMDGKPEKRRQHRINNNNKNQSDFKSDEEERYLKMNPVMEDVNTSLQYMRSKLTSPQDEKCMNFLKQMFANEQFQNAVRQHNKIVEIACSSPPKRPECEYAGELTSELCYQAIQTQHSLPAQELLSLLTEPAIKNLLDAHDAIAQQQLQPAEDEDPSSNEPLDFPLMHYGGDRVKIIRLEKTNEHLGATVKNDGDSVVIARIVKGGVAEKSGLLHEGDEILDVNGIDMRGRNINEVSEMLANMNGTITFLIIPSHLANPANVPNSNNVMDLRALFSYDPEDDDYIPCKELGISFLRGDILHAIALDDPNWWQAYREGDDEETLAGLIPSKAFTEQREKMKIDMENKENKRKGKACACGKKEKKKRRKRKTLYNGQVEDADEEILTYEELSLYYPQPNRKRPIVLIGPSNVGRQELQQRLLDSDPERFGAPTPHTTRTMKPNEVNGSTYHFISREEFDVMIRQTRFLEYGELQKNYYGTSVDSVRDVVAQGKVCLLKLQPQSLKVIRSTDLKPYVIFVCPPNLEKLRLLQDQLDKVHPQVIETERTLLTNDQMKEIIDSAREMEDQYGYMFDFVLVNSDLDRTYTELLEEINRIEMERQWVPAVWVESL